jgi:hypothetical protein
MYSRVQKLFGLNKNVKGKKNAPQNKTQKNLHKTHPPLAFSLLLFYCLLMLVLLSSSSFSFAQEKWLLSYAPPCPKNLKIKLTTNPNGTTTKLTTNPLLTKIGIEHGSQDSSFLFLEYLHYKFFLFVFLCSFLVNFLLFLFLCGVNY